MARSLTLALLAALLFTSCSDELTLEQQIIAAVTQMEALAEDGDRRGFMDMVAGDFSGQLGSLSKDEFRRFMVIQWNEYRRLQAQLFPIHVRELGPGKAAADFKALITGGPGLLPDSGQVYNIRTRWTLLDGEWLLESADWDPTGFE